MIFFKMSFYLPIARHFLRTPGHCPRRTIDKSGMIWYFSNVILHSTGRIMYGGDWTEHFPPRIIDKSRLIWYFFNEILYFLPRTTYGAGQTKHLPPRTGHKSATSRYILLSPKAAPICDAGQALCVR